MTKSLNKHSLLQCHCLDTFVLNVAAFRLRLAIPKVKETELKSLCQIIDKLQHFYLY